jgi:hypothetical protein
MVAALIRWEQIQPGESRNRKKVAKAIRDMLEDAAAHDLLKKKP